MYTSATCFQPPELLDNRRAADGMPCVPRQKFPQGEFLWTEVDGMAGTLRAVAETIHHQIIQNFGEWHGFGIAQRNVVFEVSKTPIC